MAAFRRQGNAIHDHCSSCWGVLWLQCSSGPCVVAAGKYVFFHLLCCCFPLSLGIVGSQGGLLCARCLFFVAGVLTGVVADLYGAMYPTKRAIDANTVGWLVSIVLYAFIWLAHFTTRPWSQDDMLDAETVREKARYLWEGATMICTPQIGTGGRTTRGLT